MNSAFRFKVHPGKNFAPAAADAFMKVENARTVLSDPQEKAEYDMNLNRPVESGGSRGHREYAHFETSADMKPEGTNETSLSLIVAYSIYYLSYLIVAGILFKLTGDPSFLLFFLR